MNYILLLKAYGGSSTKKIIEKMTEPCNLLMKTRDGEWQEYDVKEQSVTVVDRITEYLDADNKVINWGNHILGKADYYFELNVPTAVALSSNKRMARKVLQNAGVPVPSTWFWETDEGAFFPCIARPPHHHAGRDFHVLNSWQDWQTLHSKENVRGWYFSAIFPKTHEYRVHAAHGKVLVTHEKPLIEGELRANQAVNHESWRALKWSEYIPAVSQSALKAVEAVGLDYAAVDVMYNSKNGEVSVTEVNTSPEVTAEYTSGKYAEYFSWVIRHNFPAHFEPEGTSVFYNTILRS